MARPIRVYGSFSKLAEAPEFQSWLAIVKKK
jgi:hypothetical protein